MKWFPLLSLIACCISSAAAGQSKDSLPPDPIDSNAKAQIFGAGSLSTAYEEWATSFMPDGQTVFVSQGALYWTIVFAHRSGVGWGKPQVAPFSGRWSDTDPFVSPDGRRLYFVSNRPLDSMSGDKASKNCHLWYVDHISGDQWSEPHHLPAPVNIDGVDNYAPSVSASGTLYFCSRGRDGHEGMGSYCAAPQGGTYSQPRLLTLLGQEDTQDPFISPDEHYLLFLGGSGIYLSVRQGDHWSKARKLGPEVNSGASLSSPYVSRDGKMLYFSSSRVKGFYKRDHKVDYDGLLQEMQAVTNGSSNILMIPINLAGV